MQNSPNGSSLPKASGRRSARPVAHDSAELITVEDSVAAIAEQFGIVDTAVVTVPAPSSSQPDAADATSLPPSVDLSAGSATQAPAMTRRELRERREREAREREARELREREARDREAHVTRESAPRPLLFPSVSDAASPQPARAAGATESDVRQAAAADGVRPRRTKVTRAARRAAASSRAPRGRAAKTARSIKSTGKPRVAAAVTSTAPSKGRIAGAKRRILSQLVTVSAMAGVGLMLVATTVPANAFSRPSAAAETSVVGAPTASAEHTQELKVESVTAPAVTRDGYTVISQKQQVAAKFGNQLMLYTNNPNGTIQWPFPTGVPITSGFGGRQVAGCGFCSTNHMGVDFTPGAGTPIQAIADGTVSLVEVSNSGLGNHVVVDHVINGQKVQSVYAHMQYGSIKVAQGQQITVGQQIGNVGSTGASTGAHLHLEVHLDGTPVDPFAWLKANAN